jgi:O-Antigen ligase
LLPLLFLAVLKGLKLPVYQLVYFLFLSTCLIATASLYTPYKFGLSVDIQSIIKDYLKMAAVFLYFLVGYNLIREKIIRISLKWYSYTAVFVGTVGIFLNILGMKFLNSLYEFGGERYNGFMNDPNYFAIVQISALPYLLRTPALSLTKKILIYLVLSTSIVLSGSKTGTIALLLYTFLFIFSDVYKLKVKKALIAISGIVFFIILMGAFQVYDKILSFLMEKSFQFQRISLLFSDFNAAFNEGGSSRLSVWEAGLQIFHLSPLLGTGVGMYSNVSGKITGISSVAHNTYIQMYSEWGAIFATVFFLYVASILLTVTLNQKLGNKTNLALRDILLIMLIGSISISFNNARMFWFFLGVIAFRVSQQEPNQVSNSQ